MIVFVVSLAIEEYYILKKCSLGLAIRRNWPDVPGFDGAGRSQRCRQPLETRIGKDTDSPRGPPERNAALPAPEFSSVGSFKLWNCKIKYL